MSIQTAALTREMTALAERLPGVTADLTAGRIPIHQQHEVAQLLGELGELLHAHADDQASGIIPRPSGRDGDIEIPRARPAWALIES